MSVFHGLSLGKILQPACVVPGPATPPLDDVELEPPELLPDAPEVPELPLELDELVELPEAGVESPHAKHARTPNAIVAETCPTPLPKKLIALEL
jgi:hypothetical protein